MARSIVIECDSPHGCVVGNSCSTVFAESFVFRDFTLFLSSSALSHSNRGYSLFSFTRASAVVNCQSALV
jgi:hypothetical protein